MSAIRKYTTKVISQLSRPVDGRPKKERQRATSVSNDVILYNKAHGNRRVTFADIHDLHTRFGSPQGILKGGKSGHPETRVGYINRSCVEIIKETRELGIDSDHDAERSDEIMIENVSPNIHHKYGIIKEEEITMTFGKKGNDVGEYQDAIGVTCLTRGQILVTDMINGRIQLCSRNGETLVMYKGSEFPEPWTTCLTHGGNMAMTSRKRKCVINVSKAGEILWSFGIGFFECPSGMDTDSAHNFIVSDVSTNRVSIHDITGQFIRYVGNPTIKEEQLSKPRYVCVSSNEDIIVSDSGHHCIKIFDRNGHFKRSVGQFGKLDGQLKAPYGVCTDEFGHILVADHYNNRVSMFTQDGAFLCHVIGEQDGVLHPKGIALSHDLMLYVTVGNLKACQIKRYKLTRMNPQVIVDV